MNNVRALVLSLLLAFAGLYVPATAVAVAQTAPHCDPGAVPRFVFGFAALKTQLGSAMGDPVSCEYADPNGTGDTLQDTSAGLAFWRKSTNTPTFTDGATHWALENVGLVSWTGASIDPPPVVAAPPTVAAPAPPAPSVAAPLPPAPAVDAPPPPVASSSSTCGAPANAWGYTFCGGAVISSPPSSFCSVFGCIASFWNQTNGYVVQCQDGTFSHSGGVRGSCSGHGGNGRTLYQAR